MEGDNARGTSEHHIKKLRDLLLECNHIRVL